jgi:hypothetical protein
MCVLSRDQRRSCRRPCEDRWVKVLSPLGEYPFLFRRLECREGGVAIVGTVAGIESCLLLDRDDLRKATRVLAASLAATLLAVAWRSRRRR